MANVQIKNVPNRVHDELRRRAGQRGKTIREYVLDLIRRDQLYPTLDDWLEELDSLPKADLSGTDVADLVHEARSEREGELAASSAASKRSRRARGD